MKSREIERKQKTSKNQKLTNEKSKYPKPVNQKPEYNEKLSRNGKLDNPKLQLECLRLSSDGAGVGYSEGKATFVPGILPGEIGEIQVEEQKKNWQRGKLLSVSQESKERIHPPCTVFGVCGGCQLQHLQYTQTLEWKRRWVEDALTRIGKVSLENATIHPTLGMEEPWRYRNKARMHRGEQNILGYYQEKSNQTVQFKDCLLISEPMNGWIREFEKLLEGNPELNTKTITFRENSRGEGMLILDPVPDQSTNRLSSLSTKLEKWLQSAHESTDNLANIRSIWGITSKGTPEILYGDEDFTEELLGYEFRISPLAFLQVNPSQTRRLYQTALQWANLSGDQIVWDLYSGIGTITLALAAKAKKVWGIEENPYAVEDARKNAQLNEVSNIEFIAGKVEDTFLQIPEKPDIVVLDPPRAGAHRKVLERLIELKPNRIVYVSCDPGTLGRDLGILQAGGYQVRQVQPVDMFPWTTHVETVVLIERK